MRQWLAIRNSVAVGAMFTTCMPATADTRHEKAAGVLINSDNFKVASQSIRTDYNQIVKDMITLTETPAPPFGEGDRAELYKRMLEEAGLTEVQTDPIGNVFGYRRGTGNGPLVVIAAHLDTVFPKGTDTTVKRDGNKLSAPGIGDDTANLAVLLGMLRAMNRAGYQTRGDIIFMGDVGEEGLGDARGIRYLFEKSPLKQRITYFISFDGGSPNSIVDAAIGVKRYQVTFHGPGGHSYGAFGTVNPAFAMADAITQISKLPAPKSPKTTYSVGIVEGGTSVNAIPSATSMLIDIRSETQTALDMEVEAFLAILPKAVANENAARDTSRGAITVETKVVGSRPAGATPSSSDIWQYATAVRKIAGYAPTYSAASGDSNIPMSLGVQALTLGGGFNSEHAHSPDEFLILNKEEDVKNMSYAMATVLLLANQQ